MPESPVYRLPVAVLEHNIVPDLERLAKSNSLDLERAVRDGKVDPEIDYILAPITPRGASADLNTRQIRLYESHLAFLWAYAYSNFVIFEQCVQKPMMEDTFSWRLEYPDELTRRAKKLQDWAISFSKQFSRWDENLLPNPKQPANGAEQDYYGKANAVALRAVSFMLLHEHAHLVLGHQRTKDDKHWLLEQEKEADNFALSCLADDLSTEMEREIAGLSLVLLCASNFYLPKDMWGIWQSAHPHLHDRLRNSIAGLNLVTDRAKYYLYHLASIALQQYLTDQESALDPVEAETAEDLFYDYLDRIDELQSDTS